MGNPLATLGGIMLLALGGIILLAVFVASGTSVPFLVLGALLVLAGVVLLAMGRGGDPLARVADADDDEDGAADGTGEDAG
ncbi:MAG: hypothetical protein ACYDCK_10425 [Thermoplasmatota archaeon]